MVKPVRRSIAVVPHTVHDLREEFLAFCRAKNLGDRTLEWYEEKTHRFAQWCSQAGIIEVANLTPSHIDAFLIDIKDHGYAPQTVRGFAQVVKTLCRFGYRRGFLADDPFFISYRGKRLDRQYEGRFERPCWLRVASICETCTIHVQ